MPKRYETVHSMEWVGLPANDQKLYVLKLSE